MYKPHCLGIFIHQHRVFFRTSNGLFLSICIMWFVLRYQKILFIERLAIDSRDVAIAHTGGLSCHQQAFMGLLVLFELLDTSHAYKKTIQTIKLGKTLLLLTMEKFHGTLVK